MHHANTFDRRQFIAASTLGAIAAPRIIRSDTSRSARVDALFAAYAKPRTPGLNLAIVRGNDVVHAVAYGCANVEHDIPWQYTTRYHIASITKQFAGALLLILERQGRLKLADPVLRYLPELPEWAQGLQVRHLLCHQGGFPVDEPLLELGGIDLDAEITNDAMFALICRQRKLNFSPGTFYHYNDSGSRFATRIAERVMDQDIVTLAREQLFAPAGMTQSEFVISWADTVRNAAETYLLKADGSWRTRRGNLESSGDGAVVSCLPDLIRWWQVLRNGTAPMNRSMVEQLTQTQPLPQGRQGFYALGWRTGTHRGERYFGHTGSTHCALFAFPESDTCIIALGNRDDLDRATLAFRIFDAYHADKLSRGKAEAGTAWHAVDATEKNAVQRRRFVAPQSGYVLDLEHHQDLLRIRALGEDAVLRESLDGWWRAEYGSATLALKWLDQSKTRCALDLGQSEPLQFEQRSLETVSAAAANLWHGIYYSAELRSSIEFFNAADQLRVRLGPGLRPDAELSLQQSTTNSVTHDGKWVAQALNRDSTGAPQRLHVSAQGAWNVEFTRI
jgi:CubicO group peptidase (beta-lactamase class C family)